MLGFGKDTKKDKMSKIIFDLIAVSTIWKAPLEDQAFYKAMDGGARFREKKLLEIKDTFDLFEKLVRALHRIHSQTYFHIEDKFLEDMEETIGELEKEEERGHLLLDFLRALRKKATRIKEQGKNAAVNTDIGEVWHDIVKLDKIYTHQSKQIEEETKRLQRDVDAINELHAKAREY